MKQFGLSVCLLLVAQLAIAETRPYALEVLVFARPEPIHSISEQFPRVAPPGPDESFDFEFALMSNYKNLRELPNYSHVLANEASRIQSQLGGRILFHQRWIYPLTEGQANSPWFRIQGNRGNFTLEGFMRWSIDRFIELDTDLRVTRSGVGIAPDGTALNEVYRLTEFRKMASADVHYLDHPAFGVLIASEPIELAPEPSDPVPSPDAQSALERPHQPLVAESNHRP